MWCQRQVEDEAVAFKQSFFGAAERAPKLAVAPVVHSCLVNRSPVFGNAIRIQIKPLELIDH